jgi:hypothetical protein
VCGLPKVGTPCSHKYSHPYIFAVGASVRRSLTCKLNTWKFVNPSVLLATKIRLFSFYKNKKAPQLHFYTDAMLFV